MKIGVISDTHLSKPSDELYRLMDGVFADVSMVLHAGDLTRIAVLEAFSEKEVISVCGNMDHYDVRVKLQSKELIKVGGYRIGMVHGWGYPIRVEDRIIESFEDVHVIVYGHTHKPVNYIKNGILMFNPGAFSGTFLRAKRRSVGILTIGDGISGTIIKI